MCGRFTLDASPEDLTIHFGLEQPPALTARYNVAPSQLIAVVAPKAGPSKRGIAMLKWGLVPDWSNDAKPGPINARAETVANLPTFEDSFRSRRCIIPATGFYEWRGTGGRRVPYRFHLSAGGIMGFAGLWAKWEADGTRLFSCCIITTAANELVRPFHDRMPAVLAPADYETWFDHDAPLSKVHALLKPFPAGLMAVSEANVLVNSPRNEGPQLLVPAA
jgi:putative SOS response-associated peptidase YedK